MIENAHSEIDVEDLMRRICEVVAQGKGQLSPEQSGFTTFMTTARTSITSNGRCPQNLVALNRIPENKTCIGYKESYSLADFVGYHDGNFIRSAYRGILRREPDADSYEHYLNLLYIAQISKVEILGRLRYSKEGRALAVPVQGLLKPFILQTTNRLPILGSALIHVKTMLRLPTIVHNRVSFENYSLRQQCEQVEQINILATQIENAFLHIQETLISLTHALETKADNSRIEHKMQVINSQIHDQKINILDQQRRLAMLLEEARKRLPEPFSTEQLTKLVTEEDHLLDAFYVSFEDKFRGTRNDIKQRATVYLPVVQAVMAVTNKAPILDVGCGRGEWLELLQEHELNAQGVDLNRIMISHCLDIGLDAKEDDAIEYIRTLKSNSLGAVTGMHIIEHIPFKKLTVLFDEVLRVLKPGGVAICETPNPENIVVGACNFYYDPTHLNPLPPEPMSFIMQARGFGPIEILRLHPYEESEMLKEGSEQLKSIVNKLLFGPRDYALIAYKA